MPVQPKLIYLTRRASSLTREAFTARWRQHATLGMSLPRWRNIARYVHCDLIMPGADEHDLLSDHDGIGIIWHRSPAHRAAHLADSGSRAAMEADERATFRRPIVEVCAVTAETILLPVDDPGAWKLSRFAASGQEVKTPEDARGHVCNLPLAPERKEGWGLSCARIDELWFASRAASIAAARMLQGEGVRMVLGRDTELYRLTEGQGLARSD